MNVGIIRELLSLLEDDAPASSAGTSSADIASDPTVGFANGKKIVKRSRRNWASAFRFSKDRKKRSSR